MIPNPASKPTPRRSLASVILWSVIPAAFIGPGTVTSCLAAGQSHGATLLWTMTFSVIACVLLQTAAARVAGATDRELATALRLQHREGWPRTLVSALIVVAIGFGCAAYQAGNVLGASAGLALLVDLPQPARVAIIVLGAGALLWSGVGRSVKGALSAFVAVMGVTFLIVAATSAPPPLELVRGAIVPTIPQDALPLVLALVGTTIVPYNLFLGSSLAIGKDPKDARFGILVAVTIGGIISAGIVVAGSVVTGELTFPNVAAALESRLGGFARPLFAIGLFAAGFTSAVTAPLAAALTIDAMTRRLDEARNERGTRFRSLWIAVLAVGAFFGVRETRPVEAILLAQAANGLLLPIVAIFLYRIASDPNVVRDSMRTSRLGDVALLVAVGVTILIGLLGLAKAAASAGLPLPDEATRTPWVVGIAVAVTLALGFGVATRRSPRS